MISVEVFVLFVKVVEIFISEFLFRVWIYIEDNKRRILGEYLIYYYDIILFKENYYKYLNF